MTTKQDAALDAAEMAATGMVTVLADSLPAVAAISVASSVPAVGEGE